jgi:hypothetical protein
MTALTDARHLIQEEETRYRAAVSEATMSRMGQTMNFINNRQHSEKQFFLNGRYNVVPTPNLAVDGLAIFEFNAEIIGVWMFNMFKGTSGTTELDLKWTNQSGGTFASIFSTTPKISSTAPDFAYVGIGTSGTGLTPPALIKTQFNAGDALRLDLMSAQSGLNVASCGLIVHYRPR